MTAKKMQGGGDASNLVEKLSISENVSCLIRGCTQYKGGGGATDSVSKVAESEVIWASIIQDNQGHHFLEPDKGLISPFIATCISHACIFPLDRIEMTKVSEGQVVQVFGVVNTE